MTRTAFDLILVRLESVLVDPDDGRVRAGLAAFCAELSAFGAVRVVTEWEGSMAEETMRDLAREGHIPRAWGEDETMPLLVYPPDARPPLATFGPPGRVLLIDAFPPPSDADAQWMIRARWIPASLDGVLRAIHERVRLVKRRSK